MKSNPSFLNLNDQTASSEDTPYAVLQVPYERTVCYGKGTALGPAAIIDASRAVENFDEELMIPLDLDVQTIQPINFQSVSDKDSMTLIHKTASKAMERNRFLLSLGGEHTVSAPLVEAADEKHGPLAVLQLDAHLDLHSKYTGTSLSHACVMRRIRERKIPVVPVGIRNISREEFDYVTANQVKFFQARDMPSHERDKWTREIIALLPQNVYLSIDIDVLDPALVPGTGTPEPGGLQWYDLLHLVRTVVRERNLVSADIVETAPIPGTNVSEYTAARLAVKLLLYHKHRDLL